MKILLLEDEAMLNESICEYLNSLGYKTVGFVDGIDALDAIKNQNFDLLILDINVPNLDGLSFLQTLHSLKIHTPAIFISALVDIEDISKAYELGCKDYIKKPFHLKELSLRIDRVRNTTQTLHKRLTKHYSYNQESNELLFDNEVQILTKRQSQIINLLAKNRGRIVDFDQFLEYVWSDQFVDNSTIRAEINRLKKNLKEDFIINVRGMGYMIDKI